MKFTVWLKSSLFYFLSLIYFMCTDVCVYGDYRAPVSVEGTVRMSCTDMGSQRPYACYDQRIAAQCCLTCSSLRKANMYFTG